LVPAEPILLEKLEKAAKKYQKKGAKSGYFL
jgi:hypothetical protein